MLLNATLLALILLKGGAEIEQAKSLLDANYNGVLFSRMVSLMRTLFSNGREPVQLEDATDRFSEPYLKYIMAVMQVQASSCSAVRCSDNPFAEQEISKPADQRDQGGV